MPREGKVRIAGYRVCRVCGTEVFVQYIEIDDKVVGYRKRCSGCGFLKQKRILAHARRRMA